MILSGGKILLKMKRIYNHIMKMIGIVMLAVLVLAGLPVQTYAKESYISDITVAVGADGRASLENRGYNVLFQGMNLVSDEDSAVFLGYKTGYDAITDLVVSTQCSDTVSYNGLTYHLVSGTSLNSGTYGRSLYLYYTKDSSAGSKITSLDTASGFSDTDEVISLRNDGSSPVHMIDGTLANMDSGIANSEIYLLMYRSVNIKRYISNVCLVTGSTKASAVNQAASLGCDYYLDKDIGGSSSVSYIAYQRTSDKNKALTGFTIKDSAVQTENDGRSGARLIDITDGRIFEEIFELGDWAGVYASYDRSVTRSSSEYKALLRSTEECSCILAGSPEIYASYEGKFTLEDTEESTSTEETSEETSEDDTSESSEGDAEDESDITDETEEESALETAGESEGDAVDEFFDIDKSEDEMTEEESTDTESDAVASVINSGNVIKIICILIIIALAIIGACIYRRNKKRKEKDTSKSEKDVKETEEKGKDA